MMAAALVTVPDVMAMPRATAWSEGRPRSPRFLDAGQDEHVVVHREAEQDREDDHRHERFDRPRLDREDVAEEPILEHQHHDAVRGGR
jgi:hypothetical protein